MHFTLGITSMYKFKNEYLQASELRQVCRSGREIQHVHISTNNPTGVSLWSRNKSVLFASKETSARVVKVVFCVEFLPGKDYNASLGAEKTRSHSYESRVYLELELIRKKHEVGFLARQKRWPCRSGGCVGIKNCQIWVYFYRHITKRPGQALDYAQSFFVGES